MNFARATLAPIGSAFAAALTLMTLAFATAAGQQADVAAYGLGASVAGITGALVAGGTSLAYAAGTLAEQRAIRRLRTLALAPISLGAVTTAAAIASSTGRLEFVPTVAGGLSAIATNLSEIELAYLRSRLRMIGVLATEIGARTLALTLVVIGGSFSIAVAAGMTLRFSILAVQARHDPARRTMNQALEPPKLTISKPLYVGNAAQILTDRAIFIAAPLMLTAESAGLIATALMAVQALSAVMTSGLQVALSVRAQRGGAPWVIAFEVAIATGALSAAGFLVLLYSSFEATLGLTSMPFAAWVTICIGLPLAVFSRITLFRHLAAGSRNRMAIAQTASALSAMIYLVVLASTGARIETIAATYVVAEGVAFVTSVVLFRRRRGRRDGK